MDPSDLWMLIAYIVLIFLSALFSGAETAYTTVNKVRLRTLSANGNNKASKVLKFAENYDKVISTILIGNNIVNITIATLGTLLFTSLLKSSQGTAATISTVITTVLLLVFAEVSPKLLAKESPEKFCFFLYPFMLGCYYVLLPLNMVFTLWKKLLKKIFRFSKISNVTGDELKTYVETAENDGEITRQESELIRSAIEFDDLDVYDIMTPRVNIITVEENESMDSIAEKFFEHGYSRLPVYSKSIDNIIGILHEKDFYYLTRKDGVKISDIVQSSICVSKSMKISAALKMLQKAKIHMAVVVDEFGGTSGIITLEDIIEELVGEIWDEHDEVEVLLKRMDDSSYIVSGSENLETMFESFSFETAEEFDSTTVGGWVTEQMGKIPVAGEKMEYKNLCITVTKATANKVVEIRVRFKEEAESDE